MDSLLNIKPLIDYNRLETQLLIDKGEWQHLFMLLKLADMGAYNRTAKISTDYLAKKLGISQQTASRYLIKLERKGWINRKVTTEGSLVRIEQFGMVELQRLYSNLKVLMENSYPPSVTLEGVVFTGLGEGAYYLSKPDYKKQILDKFGFEPYPGTLNIKLSTDYDIKTRSELEKYPAIEIMGFQGQNRSYGLVKCYPAIIGGQIKGALVTAKRSHYDSSVLELIAPVCLRKQLGIKDGSKVKVEICTRT